MASLRFKVQHNSRELGPYTVAELRQAMDSGRLCMMDWCWNHDSFGGIMTVYQVLSDGGANGAATPTSPESVPRMGSLALGKQAEAEMNEARLLAVAKTEFEEYRRRTLHDIQSERSSIAEARRKLGQEQAAYYRECAKTEAETVHLKEDISREKATLTEERNRFGEVQRRHARNLSAFENARKTALTHIAEDRRKAREERHQLMDEAKLLTQTREDLEQARNRAAAENDEARERLKVDQKRHLESSRRLNEEKAAFQERSAAAAEQQETDKARIADERKQLAAIERSLRAERQQFDEQRRIQLSELQAQRRELEVEKRLLSQHRHVRTHSHSGKASPEAPKDERHYGRILGLSGKVSFEEIKRSYRFAAFRCHPDKVQDLDPEFVALATSKIRELNEAFEFFKARYEPRHHSGS